MRNPDSPTIHSPAMSRLPPSPDTTNMAAHMIIPEFSLDDDTDTIMHRGNLSNKNVATGATMNNNNNNNNNNNTTGHHQQQNAPTSRLRSVAKYNAFHPQALACSNEISAIAGPRGIALFRLSSPHIPLLIFSHATNYSSSSGKKYNQSRNSISSLAFQPTGGGGGGGGGGGEFTNTSANEGYVPVNNNANTLYLAAARGSGVLIWDASGHSQNPLLGRLLLNDLNDSTIDSTGGSRRDSDTLITSMSWMLSSGSRNNTPLLATTTASSLSMWDLRCHGSSQFQPSLRFCSSRNANIAKDAAPIVQVACSTCSEECATIDASGIVRTYDLRKTGEGGGRSSTGYPLAVFMAHEAGVGIQHMERHDNGGNKGSAWVTWGLETQMSSAVVKVWGVAAKSLTTTTAYDDSSDSIALGADKDEYWFMGEGESQNTPSTKFSTNNINSNYKILPSSEYQLIAQYARSNMCCARVCPTPVNNSLVVVGYLDRKSDPPSSSNGTSGDSSDGWWVDLLSLSSSSQSQSQLHNSPDENVLYKMKRRSNFGLDKIVSFCGGAANTDVDKKSLMSVLGNTNLGKLQASELAFSSSIIIRANDRTSATTTTDDGSIEKNEKEEIEAGTELLLCCLSDSGVLTTTAIPEAIRANNRIDDQNNNSSPQRSLTRSNIIRTAFGSSANNHAKVFPDTKEGDSLLDVASIWGSLAGNVGDLTVSRGDDKKIEQLRSSSPLKLAAPKEDPLRNSGRRGEGGFLPFDMDVPVPVAYNSVTTGNLGGMSGIQIGMTDMTPLSAVINTSEDGEEISALNSTSIMENIDKERVPCPRLCGAVFGSGNGRLVIFRNGEVKKMWNWYQRTDTIRLSSIPGGQVDVTSSSDPQTLITSPKTSEESGKRYQIASSSGPRTLKELVDMTTAAKEAQWGEENDSKDDALSVMENFFEEDSLESNSDDSSNDDDDDDDDGDDDEIIQNKDEIYKRYFGGGRTWKGYSGMRASMPQGTAIESTRSMLQRSMLSVGPSSDMLQPIVTVAHPLNVAALDIQGILLAKGWKLGRWENRETYPESKFESNIQDQPQLLPYPDVTPKKGKSSFSRAMSVPNFSEISERPNVEESMTFLKKLFTHQQEDGVTFPTTLMSPPDSPILMNKTVSRAGQDKSSIKHKSNAENMRAPDLGVHNLRIQKHDMDTTHLDELEEIRQLCLHNARISKDCREVEKESVWNILAETVLSQMGEDDKVFNGWGGKAGGALGVDMINNFFLYYEALQDVQMLATMFCVLSDRHHQDQRTNRLCLLPESREKVCDTYIIRYAEVLYSWGLLNTRAELNKHLQRKYERNELNFIPIKEGKEEEYDLGVALSCPTCHNGVDSRTNYCQSCRDFAFRCSICDIAVRGIFTFCDICQHGGHLRHMVNWFKKNSSCPTGCGCQCIFSKPEIRNQEMAISNIS